ncbi:hypothetical protein CEXT_470561 [Caerostris extrusa]|uniref:Uncharacterized protein n=1 Tax=Caerostris extrusa TaxID=172846 RepID=A0AAV4S2H1_CAEEX|nr:hypothetical protein CEXT_470561 [Caerostris extrusa]
MWAGMLAKKGDYSLEVLSLVAGNETEISQRFALLSSGEEGCIVAIRLSWDSTRKGNSLSGAWKKRCPMCLMFNVVFYIKNFIYLESMNLGGYVAVLCQSSEEDSSYRDTTTHYQ